MNTFEPDYRNILKVLYNQKPDYLPLYEHNIDAPFVSKCIGEELSLNGRKSCSDLDEYFSKYISFWKENTYDAFSYEAAICEILPGHGAILGGCSVLFKPAKILTDIRLTIFPVFSGKHTGLGWSLSGE